MNSIRLPDSIRRYTGSVPMEAETIGRSGADVVKLGGMYLKIAPEGTLQRTAEAQAYFCKKKLSSQVLAYERTDGRDWLLTEAVAGSYACSEAHMAQPGRLAAVLGETVRMLHETNAADCPLSGSNELMLHAYAAEAGHAFRGDISPLREDVLLHGDMCLPNIFFSDFRFTGFIDLGDAGPGDRHFDLYWAMWSLGYNLKTDRYNNIFMDAYGRDAFDPVRYDLCAAISGCV